jgi:hypothetical protein
VPPSRPYPPAHSLRSIPAAPSSLDVLPLPSTPPSSCLSSMSAAKIKVAVPQQEPCYLDAAAGTLKTIAIMEEAAKEGVQLIAFGELVRLFPPYLRSAALTHTPASTVASRLPVLPCQQPFFPHFSVSKANLPLLHLNSTADAWTTSLLSVCDTGTMPSSSKDTSSHRLLLPQSVFTSSVRPFFPSLDLPADSPLYSTCWVR